MRARYVLGAVAVLAVGVPAAVLVLGASTTHAASSAASVTSVSTCPYVADGGSAGALVTVQAPRCAAVNPDDLGQVNTYASFTLDTPADDPALYPDVAAEASDGYPAACRVSFPAGVTVTVYGDALDAVQPMVCAALNGTPATAYP